MEMNTCARYVSSHREMSRFRYILMEWDMEDILVMTMELSWMWMVSFTESQIDWMRFFFMLEYAENVYHSYLSTNS